MTQATVSRDIRELKLTKAPGKKWPPVLCSHAASERFWREIYPYFQGLLCVQGHGTEYSFVIKTVSGMAMAVAEALDVIGLQIVGCVAGDNTIM